MDCSVQRPKELKKSTRPGNFTPMPTLYPLSGVSQFWHVGSGAGRNQSCQISTRSVQGFGAPGGRKSLSPIDWRYRPYNSVSTNVLHCDVLTISYCQCTHAFAILIAYKRPSGYKFFDCLHISGGQKQFACSARELTSNYTFTSSSAIAERPRCRVRQLWPKVEHDILQTI